MNLSKDIIPFLSGKKFSSSVPLRLDGESHEVSRLEFIKKTVIGKKVLHVGCVDHSPEKVQEKLADNTWLHKMIMDRASHCAGVDIQQEGVKFIKESLNIQDVYYCDITKDKVEGVTDVDWDYVVLGEMLEHVDDPVNFLAKIRSNLNFKNTKLIITVPNAFFYKNFKAALKGFEDINSDHRYWFTPYTLSKVVMCAGYEVDEIHLTQDSPPTLSRFFPYFILKKYPFLRSKVVMVAK